MLSYDHYTPVSTHIANLLRKWILDASLAHTQAPLRLFERGPGDYALELRPLHGSRMQGTVTPNTLVDLRVFDETDIVPFVRARVDATRDVPEAICAIWRNRARRLMRGKEVLSGLLIERSHRGVELRVHPHLFDVSTRYLP